MRHGHGTWWASRGMKKLAKHWWTESKTTTNKNVGSNQETCWHQCKSAALQRADAEILMDAQPQGPPAARADEEHIELEILPVASLSGPREPSKDEIEKHNLLHDPAMPKGRDDFHRQARPNVLPVIQFDYAVCWYTSRTATCSTSWLGLIRAQAQLGHSLSDQRPRGSIHCLMVVRTQTY